MGWKDLVQEKNTRQQAAIPKDWLLKDLPPESQLDVSNVPETCGLLSPKELTITNSSVDVLLSALAKGEWTSVQVTTAFYKRAIIAHQLTNCLTEIFVEKALARAAEMDQYLKATGKVFGPLHGLPISLKDQISLEGIESTMGYVSWIGTYAERDSVLVQALKNAGAIPFVKTNIPQTLMWPETFNIIFGRTVNPYNRELTCGGSSGGEGALIAMKGSPLGVGSDIGGSVRIPASFCGIYGLRPSAGRIPYAGCVNSIEGQDSVLSVLGPMCTSIHGLKTFVQAVMSQKPWLKDPLVIPKQWNELEYSLADHGSGQGPLCFGILWNDGKTMPHPPVIRALEIVKSALLAAGHHVVNWKPLKHEEIYAVLDRIYGAASKEDYDAVTSISGEPLIISMSPNEEIDAVRAAFRLGNRSLSAFELFQAQLKKRTLREEYLQHWEDTVFRTGTGRPIDAIISPTAPYPAPPHGKNLLADYTMIWNALDYSALVIPVTKVDQSLDVFKEPRQEFFNDFDKSNYEAYDPAIYANAPVSVQIVGRRLEEEAVIAMSEVVDAALKAHNV